MNERCEETTAGYEHQWHGGIHHRGEGICWLESDHAESVRPTTRCTDTLIECPLVVDFRLRSFWQLWGVSFHPRAAELAVVSAAKVRQG